MTGPSVTATAMRFLVLATAFLSTVAIGSVGEDPVVWPDTPRSRLQAFALLQELNGNLLSHDSATLTLDRWCATHHLAASATIVANRDKAVDKVPTAAQRQALAVGADQLVRYRRVRLSCGDRVLSEADNWYVPSRLTPEMNRMLDTSDVAFGRVVQPLHFQRHTQSAEMLWQPLPVGWESGAGWQRAGGASMTLPHAVIQHQAVLTLPDGTPFSEVVETYTSAVLDFPIAPLP